MRQQVNLYQPIFQKQRIIFSARTIFLLSLGFLALLLLWSFLVSQRVGHLEREQERQAAAEQQAVNRLNELREQTGPTEPSAELEAYLEQLMTRRSQLRNSLSGIGRRLPTAEADLLGRLDALGRQRPHGLWLTSIRLGDHGQQMTLQGRALGTQLVPAYLDALSAEPLISGLRFQQVRVSASEDTTPGVIFTLSTRPEEQP